MRDLVLRGEPYSATEREAILNYCESDVEALARLLPIMLPAIDLPRACSAVATWPRRHGWSGSGSP